MVIGIGGSYLGAKAAVDFLARGAKREAPEILFAGNSFSTDSITDTIEKIGDRDFSVNVISKSGTTLEPAIAFRVFRELLEKKYGKEAAAKRIYATTDKEKGVLKEMADRFGYETFTVPDDIGGRFSVLSSVGLLPIAVTGADVEEVLKGAAAMRERCKGEGFDTNPALRLCQKKARRSKYSAFSTLPFSHFPAGGDNFSESRKERTAKACFPPA